MKKIYLDWSHLQVLCEKQRTTKEEELLKHNFICISFNHLIDLSGGTDKERVIERAKFLDMIPNKLFLLAIDELQVLEMIREIEKIFIKSTIVPEDVFIKKIFYQILGDHVCPGWNYTIQEYAEDMCENKGLTSLDSLSASSVKMSKIAANDRSFVQKKKKHLELETIRKKKNRDGLSFFIGHAIFLLVLYGVPASAFFKKNENFYIEFNGDHVCLNDYFMEPLSLCFYHIHDEFLFLHTNDLSGKELESKRFIKTTRSDLADFGHVYALICCDAVTCDETNYKLLKQASENLGIPLNNLKKNSELT